MSDRELLAAAARAAGLHIDKSATNGARQDNTGFDLLGNAILDWHNNVKWNPLTDDGDALRLAVKLNLHIGIDAESAGAITIEWDFDGSGTARRSLEQDAPVGGDDYAATRRAIVRAAAALSPVSAPHPKEK